MSESFVGRKSCDLAVVDRKPTSTRKSGGCVGIFFQLFDWNRRLSKKKFFPKKLLPPARTKVAKKFNAGEKLPVGKHLMIAAHENNGGFPNNAKQNAKPEVRLEVKKHEMKAPGLVARLMGLEALPVPVANQGNLKNGSTSDSCKGQCARLDSVSVKTDSSPEKGILRPQKLQKIGFSERRPVTRFGVEALQIKNAWSRSRKHHHVKLLSPVKSPKFGRNTSRLIDAAARILEPGIQATNRARCRLTYPNSTMVHSHGKDVMTEMNGDMDLQFECDSMFGAHNSCRNCGDLLESVETRFEPPMAKFRENLLHGVEESRPRTNAYLENETEVVLLKTRPVENELTRNIMHQHQQCGQMPGNRMFTSQKNASTSYTSKHRNQRQGQMLIGDKVPPRSKLVNPHPRRLSTATKAGSENKDFIALNRNLSRTRLRVPIKSDSLATQTSPVRKRRTLDAATGSTSSLLAKQKIPIGNVMNRNRPRTQPDPKDPTCVTSQPINQRGRLTTDVVSFAFSSPVKSRVTTLSDNQNARFADDSLQKKIVMDGDDIRKGSQNSLRISGNALEALLQQKLKELRNEVDVEEASAKTTASILQEIISALNGERPISHDDESRSGGDSVKTVSQSKFKIEKASDSISCQVDHFSPGCVIDASFSNESCISSSIDDNSGQIQRSDCTSLSFDKAQPTYADADLLDSASSTINTTSSDLISMTDLLAHTSAVLQNVNLVHTKLAGTKFNYVQEIILNSEMLFSNGTPRSSTRFIDFLVGPFLDELETLVIAAWKNTVILGLEVRKEESPLRKFLFDSVIECLDVRYNRYSNFGYRTWSRLPKCMNADVLIKVYDEEVRKWIAVCGKALDEIIEKEMSTSLGKWTDFEIEAFETASLVNQDLVQTLVDEIVIDLFESDLSL